MGLSLTPAFLLDNFQFVVWRNRAQEERGSHVGLMKHMLKLRAFKTGSLKGEIPGELCYFFFSKNPFYLTEVAAMKVYFLELPSRKNLLRSSFSLQPSGASPLGSSSAFEAKLCSSHAHPKTVTQHGGLLRPGYFCTVQDS